MIDRKRGDGLQFSHTALTAMRRRPSSSSRRPRHANTPAQVGQNNISSAGSSLPARRKLDRRSERAIRPFSKSYAQSALYRRHNGMALQRRPAAGHPARCRVLDRLPDREILLSERLRQARSGPRDHRNDRSGGLPVPQPMAARHRSCVLPAAVRDRARPDRKTFAGRCVNDRGGVDRHAPAGRSASLTGSPSPP